MKMKRIFALALALLVGVSALGGMPLSASAAGTGVSDAYVLTYDGAVEGYAYGDYPFMYRSPFEMYHGYSDPEAGSSSVWKYYYTNEIFQLVNTTKLAEGGTGAFASIPVYCTDVDTNTREAATYRRINLEDSTYHETGAAARLRAVVLNSFPYIQDVSAIAAAANVWLAANDMTAIENLQIGEAMLATQQAIWKITHGDKYSILDPYTGCNSYNGTGTVYTMNSEETETVNTENNIIGLHAYFMSLEGMAPLDDAVSEYSFENLVYGADQAEDGTWTVTVDVDIVTTVGEGDSLTLTATCGQEAKTTEVEEGGAYSVTFEGLAEPMEVKLQLSGYQVGGDVYLFDAEGDRTASQSFIGYDDSCLPVYGEVTASPDRVINIHKTTTDGGEIPLANIEFDIYKVATMAQIESGEVQLSEKPTEEELDAYQNSAHWIATLKTDAQGNASYNFTENGQPDGVYLIVERNSAATTGPVSPFFVIIPGTNEDGDGHEYTINVNPKNTAEQGPDIKKDVTEIGNQEDTFDVDEIHTWIIRGGVPSGIGTAQKYEITDTIDYRLTYQSGSPVVKLYTKAGEEIQLTLGDHYTLTESKTEVDGRTVDRFVVALTPAGMAYVANNLGSGTNTPEVRIYFQAVINSDASLGVEIPNQAHLDYTNSAGLDYDADSEEPKVYTGGTSILKTNVDGDALKGASFKIAREATEAELADESVTVEKLTVNGKALDVVFQDFYTTADLSGEKVYEVTTDENGKALIYGLAYGTYYIVETKAPEGYNLLTAPVKVTIYESSHLEENAVKVINTKFVLPDTGGMGTTVFTVTGLAIIGSAAILILLNSKKRKA